MAYVLTIEIRVDFDTANKKQKEPIAASLAKQCAAELLTKITMICDSRAPQISISDGDFFSETKEIKLLAEDMEQALGNT